jgi:hypothetical protein
MLFKSASKVAAVLAMAAIVVLSVVCSDRSIMPVRNVDNTPLDPMYFKTSYDPKDVPSDPITIELPAATVYLSNVYFDRNLTVLEIPYMYEVAGNNSFTRVLTLTGSVDEASAYYEVRVDNSVGELMFLFSVSGDAADTNTIVMTEKTLVDSLSIVKTVVGELNYERYNLNGSIYEIEYTEDERNAYLLGKSQESYIYASSPGDNSPTDKFKGFIDFYPEDMTLNHNTDGIVLVELLQSEEFMAWLRAQLGIPELEHPEKVSVDTICKIAGYGTAKCWLGGWANPLCHVAVGVSFACLVKDIYDELT